MTPSSPRTTYARMKQVGLDIGPAFVAAWPYMLLGLLTGALILYAGTRLFVPETIWFRLSEHLGAGFVVSALAVFGYEWRAHIIKTMNTARELTESIIDAKAINHSLVETGRLLGTIEKQEQLRTAAAKEGLKRCLKEVVLLEENDPLIRNCEELISNISALRKRNNWIDRHYLSFISGILHDLVVKPSRLLEALGGDGEEESDEDRRLLVTLDSAEVGDRLLAAHMNALLPGDSYWVVSDLNTWKGDRLELFRRATEAAIKERGVVVTRIFDLVRHRDDFNREEMENAVRTHLQDSDKWITPEGTSGYVVKVLGTAEYKKAQRRDSELTPNRIRAIHFGLFRHLNTAAIRVEVRKPDLSDLAISRSADLIEADTHTFRTLEQVAIGITLDDLREKIQDVYDR